MFTKFSKRTLKIAMPLPVLKKNQNFYSVLFLRIRQKLKQNFCNSHRFHGNRLIILTKKCPKASFLESLMKDNERNGIDHILSLTGIPGINS